MYVLHTGSILVACQPAVERTTSLLFSEPAHSSQLCCTEAGGEDTLCNIPLVAASHMY